MSTTTKQRTSSGGYKKRLLDIRKQMASGRANVYDVATNLVAIFNDMEFRADIGATDDYAVAEALSAEVSDLCVEFLELKVMLEEFPDRQTWEDTPLTKLYDQARERIASRKKVADATERPEPRKHRSVKLAEFEALQSEKNDVAAQLNYTKRQLTDQGDRMAELENENRELRMENAELKGRLRELERVVGREFATA